MYPAPFWQRMLALLVDYVVFQFLCLPGGLICLFIFGDNPDLSGYHGIVFGSTCTAFALLTAWPYSAFMESSEYQGTLGKRITGIVVTDLSGQRIDFSRATKRFRGKIVSVLTVGYGFVMALWTPQHQALHDRIAETLVVKTR